MNASDRMSTAFQGTFHLNKQSSDCVGHWHSKKLMNIKQIARGEKKTEIKLYKRKTLEKPFGYLNEYDSIIRKKNLRP